MKPDFALTVIDNEIGILLRAAQDDPDAGWYILGTADPSAEDFQTHIEELRKQAKSLANDSFLAKVVIPNDLVKYLTISDITDPDDLEARVRDELRNATPYDLDDLVYDWSLAGTTVFVAAVARKTLLEAEGFALEHALEPGSFVAKPERGQFLGEPFFGVSDHADTVLSTDIRIEPEDQPIRIVETPASLLATMAAATPVEIRDGEHESIEETHEVISDSIVSDTTEKPVTDALLGEESEQVIPAASDIETPPDLAATDHVLNADQADMHSVTEDNSVNDAEPEHQPEAEIAIVAAPIEDPAEPEKITVISTTSDTDNSAEPEVKHSAQDDVQPSLVQTSGTAVISSLAALRTNSRVAANKLRSTDPRLLAAAFGGLVVFGLAAWGIGSSDPESTQEAAITQADVTEGSGKGTNGSLPEFVVHSTPDTLRAVYKDVPTAPETPELQDETALAGIEKTRQAQDPEVTRADETDVVVQNAGRIDQTPAIPENAIASAFAADTIDGSTDARTSMSNGVRILTGRPVAVPPARPDAQVALVNPGESATTQTDALTDERAAIRPMARSATETANEQENATDTAGNENQTAQTENNEDTVASEVADNAASLAFADTRPQKRPQAVTEPVEEVETSLPDKLSPEARPKGLAAATKPEPDTDVTTEPENRIAATQKPLATASLVGTRVTGTSNLVRTLKPQMRPRSVLRTAQDTQRAAAAAPKQASTSTRTAAVDTVASPRSKVRVRRSEVMKSRTPTPRQVAKRATDKNALRFKKINLIGVFGSPKNRRALVLLSNGQYQKVKVGDRIGGGRVSAIGVNDLRYIRNGRSVLLQMPKG